MTFDSDVVSCVGGTAEPSLGAASVTRVSPATTAGVVNWSNWSSTQTSEELLYVMLAVVLASSLITLVALMFVCAWKQRQRQRILGDCSFCLVRLM